ncbi:type III pantothenate kinase [Desulfobacterales bacterium HSG16]|nr:type III pantothenate kinase [Desulfobacterales bacterium HSG16]
MLLVIDVGNTNTVMGIYQGKTLLKDWRIRTERNTTEDEFHVLIRGLFTGSDVYFSDIASTIISSVVPPMTGILDAFCRKYLGHAPIWVNAKTEGIMPILYDNPDEVGADRIVNSVAAYHKYRQSLIIIDFGTATTFDAVSVKGEYLGGAICPGIMISSEALFAHASKLPRVEIFDPPESIIGKTTIDSIKSGLIYGYASLVDGIACKMAREMDTDPKIIATGGLAPLMASVSEAIEEVDSSLTLEGLRIINEKGLS